MYKIIAMVLWSLTAVAVANGAMDASWWWPPFHKDPAHAPEIDPASAMAALTMLAGGLAVMRGRRAKK
jgi:hypothetical protein